MNRIIELIQQKCGDLCQLRSPLDENQYYHARKLLPSSLFEILKISNGIYELMTHSNTNNGNPFVIGSILYSFDEIQSETRSFSELFGDEGIAFAGNGAGGYFVIKPNEKIYRYEYVGEDGEYFANSLTEFFSKSY